MSTRKKRTYRQLVQADRNRLEPLLAKGHSYTAIAKMLRVDKSTISREVRRNRIKVGTKGATSQGLYRATHAEASAKLRRKHAKYQGKKINENENLKNYIVEKLKARKSPDEISREMKTEQQPFYASKTAIYEWLYSERGSRGLKYLASHRSRAKKTEG